MGQQRYRVVQWATGNIGLRSLRTVIEHPDLELVGLYVYSDAKAGRDAGELCGLPSTGIIATRDIDAIVALEADCVLHMAERLDLDVICRLLESGANVVSTRSEFHRPASMDPEMRARIEAACRIGRATIHSTGSSPGFITEVMPLVLTSIQRRLDCYTIDEFADMSLRDSPEMIFDYLRFGHDPSTFDSSRSASYQRASFGGSLHLVADALGLPLDSMDSSREVAIARKTEEIAAGRIEAGTIAAQRLEIAGLRNGKPLLRFRANWYVTRDIEPEWTLRETGWRVQVEGDAPLDVGITFPVAQADYAATSPGYTAHRPVNAIPYVVAAEPGMCTTVDLPQVIAHLG